MNPCFDVWLSGVAAYDWSTWIELVRLLHCYRLQCNNYVLEIKIYFVEIYGRVMLIFRWYYVFALISNCLLNFVVLIQGTDVKGFDDTVLFKIHWPGRNGDDLLVSMLEYR